MADFEDDIFKPISEERLEITSGSPGKDGQTRKQHATLAERMRDFEKTVAVEAAHLEKLWKEWQETQLELVCLAIEVLGKDGVGFLFDKDDRALAARVHAAVQSSREHDASHADIKEKAAHLDRSIRKAADETINDLNEQEKVRSFHKGTVAYISNMI